MDKSSDPKRRPSISFLGLVQAAVVLAAFVTVVGFFDSWHWLPEVCTSIRLLLFYAATPALALFLLMKQWRFVGIAGWVIVANLGVVLV